VAKKEADLRRTNTDIKNNQYKCCTNQSIAYQIKPKDATDMPAISKEDSFNQLTIAELEKVLLCNNFNLK
jgi:hypothetical protein